MLSSNRSGLCRGKEATNGLGLTSSISSAGIVGMMSGWVNITSRSVRLDPRKKK